jgi:hypothetical protein
MHDREVGDKSKVSAETPTFNQLIKDLRSGKGAFFGGSDQTPEDITQLLSVIPQAAQAIVDETHAEHIEAIGRATRNIRPGFKLQTKSPTLRIALTEWEPGSVKLIQREGSPTTTGAWTRYLTQITALMPSDASLEERYKIAVGMASHEAAHAEVLMQHGIPFNLGIRIGPEGPDGAYVLPSVPYLDIPPQILAEVVLAPADPSQGDLEIAARSLLASKDPNADLSRVVDAPGYPAFASEADTLIENALAFNFRGDDGTNRDNQPFIGDHNRERLFGEIAELLKDL